MDQLKPCQVQTLNKEHGLSLRDDKMYIQSFLINGEQNHATDPVPFKIHPDALEKIALSALGRAWLPYPQPDGNHHRPYAAASSDEILEYQKQYAGGEIVAAFVNPDTKNASVIIDVFPEYKNAVRFSKIPNYVSPMVHNYKFNKNDEIIEGEILHLQSVAAGGYGQVAKITGVCERKDLDSCMAEMRPLAASGKLLTYQYEKNLLSTHSIASNGMDGDNQMMGVPGMGQSQQAPSAGTDVSMILGELRAKVSSLEGLVAQYAAKEEERAKATAIPPPAAAVETPAESAPTESAPAEDLPPTENEEEQEESMAARGRIGRIERTVKSLAAAADRRNFNSFKTARIKDATTIADSEIAMGAAAPAARDARIKHWALLEDNSGKLKDIDVVAAHVSGQTMPEAMGASYTDDSQPTGSGFADMYKQFVGGNTL